VNKISGYKYIQIFQFIQWANKWKIIAKITDKYENIRKHKLVILWALVIIFSTNHSSYNYSVCHKLLNMQNIYMLPSMVIWKVLITHHVSSLNITTVFPLTSHILFLSSATGKTAVHEIKKQFEFTHCKGRNMLYSVQLICKFSQYHQIKLYGNFNNITAVVTWCLKLNAACLLIWPFWLPCNEQFHSMTESIITSRSAWKVKWLSNRTEADQWSKREGVYTTLESEQFMWTYYYQMHPLGGADSESNRTSEKINRDYKKGRWNREKPWIRENSRACTNEVKEESRQVNCNGARSCRQNKQCTTESSGKSTSVEMSTDRKKTCKCESWTQ